MPGWSTTIWMHYLLKGGPGPAKGARVITESYGAAGEDHERRRDLGWGVQQRKGAGEVDAPRGAASAPEDQSRGGIQGTPRPQWTPSPWPSAASLAPGSGEASRENKYLL